MSSFPKSRPWCSLNGPLKASQLSKQSKRGLDDSSFWIMPRNGRKLCPVGRTGENKNPKQTQSRLLLRPVIFELEPCKPGLWKIPNVQSSSSNQHHLSFDFFSKKFTNWAFESFPKWRNFFSSLNSVSISTILKPCKRSSKSVLIEK